MAKYPLQMTIRWLVSGVFFAMAILGSDLIPSAWPLAGICAVVALYNLVLALPRWRNSPPQGLSLSLLVLDTVSLTAFLQFSGDIENPLRFAYVLPAAAAAILVSTRWGLLYGVCSVGAFTFMLHATWTDGFPVSFEHHHINLFDVSLHDVIDPDRNPHGMNYIYAQDFRLATVVLGVTLGFGALAKRLRSRETEIRAQRERMRLILNIIPEGIFLLSREGRILFANARGRELARAGDAERVEELDPRLDLGGRLGKFKGPVEEFETGFDGRVLNQILARTTPEGPVVWVLRDLTEHRRLMAGLIHRSKMADLGLLAAGIAHEIGNPLSSMAATIELLEMKNAPPAILDRLERLKVHIDRIGRIVQDIRSFARPSTDQRVRVLPGAVCAEAIQTFRLHARSRHVALDAAGQPEGPPIEAVPDQIVQVLLNLLINAADACPPGGRIALRIGSVGDEVRLSVQDDGVGIDEEAMKHLFTPFFTTKEPGHGTGLGLFVSDSIVRSHGGRIEVESSPGKGSTFTVVLPRAKEA